uniref:Uncharacterized protein n=1 Tax=Rhizophora mucronata TaxID=61149 RepID=A0A2P2IRC3_RHIMU
MEKMALLAPKSPALSN